MGMKEYLSVVHVNNNMGELGGEKTAQSFYMFIMMLTVLYKHVMITNV